jgi:hypothetical protein
VTTSRRTPTTYALVRIEPATPRLDLESFARAGRTHPEFVQRLYALGLLDATRDAGGELWFAPGELRSLARIQRLHAGLALDYAAAGLVADLLDRIAELEAATRRTRPTRPEPTGG